MFNAQICGLHISAIVFISFFVAPGGKRLPHASRGRRLGLGLSTRRTTPPFDSDLANQPDQRAGLNRIWGTARSLRQADSESAGRLSRPISQRRRMCWRIIKAGPEQQGGRTLYRHIGDKRKQLFESASLLRAMESLFGDQALFPRLPSNAVICRERPFNFQCAQGSPVTLSFKQLESAMLIPGSLPHRSGSSSA